MKSDYIPTEYDMSLFNELINMSNFIPCDIQICLNWINYLISKNYKTSDNENVTYEFIIQKYYSYLAWHNSKYPKEQYAPKNDKLRSLELFLQEKLWLNDYRVEIKFGSREMYLFGENIYKFNEKYEDFEKMIDNDYFITHGKKRKN